MLDFNIFKDYLPLITTLLATSLTYLFGYKKGKKEKFVYQLEDNLSGIISPLLHGMRKIKEAENSFQREKLIKNFFDKYTSEETKIYKISNKSVLDWFYTTHEYYLIFTKNKNIETWEAFWVHFEELYYKIGLEFKTVRRIIYSDYKWYLTLTQRNYLSQMLSELLVFIYETSKFLITSCLLFISFAIFDKLEGSNLIPNEITKVALYLLFILLMIVCILMTILSDYHSAKQLQKDSISSMFIKKFLPRIYHKWNSKMVFNIEKEKKKTQIPEMYRS